MKIKKIIKPYRVHELGHEVIEVDLVWCSLNIFLKIFTSWSFFR